MFKYLFGILLVQIVTVSLTLLVPNDLSMRGWLQFVIPLLCVALVVAFWFNVLAQQRGRDDLFKLKENHFKEREKIRVNAERAKSRAVKKTQKEMTKEVSRTHSKAGLKVAATTSVAVGIGAVMVMTELMTFGLLTLTATGGALSGYLYRGKKYKEAETASLLTNNNEKPVLKIINKSTKDKNKDT